MKLNRKNPILAAVLPLSILLAAASVAYAADGTWTNTEGGTWSTTDNWSIGTIANLSGSTANFNTLEITADTTVNLDSDRTLTNLIFGDTTTSTAAGWILDNNGDSTNNLILAGTTPTITVNALGTGKNVTISAIIEGLDGLTKAGAGNLFLSGSSTYSGVTTIDGTGITSPGGLLTVANNSALGAGGTGNGTVLIGSSDTGTTGNGVAINLNSVTVTDEALTIQSTANSRASLTTAADASATWAGDITIDPYIGTGAFNQIRATTADTALTIGASSANTLKLDSTVTLAGLGNGTVNSTITGTGNLEKTTGGTWTLTAANTFTGNTSMTGTTTGIVLLANSSALGNSTLDFLGTGTGGGVRFASSVVSNAFTLGGLNTTATTGTARNIALTNTDGAAIALSVGNNNQSTSYAGVISGNGSLTKIGSGILILSGNNTYSGGTTISGGTLEVNAGGLSGNIVNNASLVYSGGTPERTLGGDISGTGSLTKRGAHALTLTGTNTFEGGIVLEDRNLTAGSANIGSGDITFAGNNNQCRWFITDGSVISNDILFADEAANLKLITVATPTSHVELTGTITLAADSTTTGTSRIAPQGGTIVISGKMTGTGTGGYAKRNDGTVVITGTANDYTGPTTIVDAGTLLVDGSIQSNVFFGQNLDGTGTGFLTGTLGGSGLINANVTTQNASNLSPGGASSAGVNTHTVGTLTINGDLDVSLSAAAIGLIRMDLDAPAGSNDRINVGGQAIIGTDVLGLADFAFNNLGGLAAGTYTLISATNGINGALDPADLTGTIAPGFDGTLSNDGINIILTVAAAAENPYQTWVTSFDLAGGDAAFDFDFDNDGFANGLEWILGGNPTANDAGTLVTATGSAASGITLNFAREEDTIGVATLTVEYGTTLATWPGSATIGATSTPADGNGVVVTVNDVPNPDEVTVNIPASNAASGKLFARLKAVLLP